MVRTIMMAGGVLVVAAGAAVAWLQGGRYASTDDAYVEAPKLSVSTDVSGIVSSVNVREGQLVKAGDLLFQVDPRQFQIALNGASANLAETALAIEAMKADYRMLLSDLAAQEAQVSLDQVAFDRTAALERDNTVAKANYDQVRFALQANKNKRDSLQHQAEEQLAKLGGNADIPSTEHPLYLQAKAQVDEAQRQLDHTSVRAPFRGVVTQVDSLQPGTYLVSQTAALTDVGAVALVSSEQTWVTANITAAYVLWNSSTPSGLAALNAEVTRQASIVAYVDDFKFLFLVCLAMAPLLLLMRSPNGRNVGRQSVLD